MDVAGTDKECAKLNTWPNNIASTKNITDQQFENGECENGV